MNWKRLCILGVMITIVVGAGLIVASGNATLNTNKQTYHDSLIDWPGLDGGAYADWVADGAGTMDVAGGSAITDVLVHGRDEESFTANVEVTAIIGAKSTTLLNEDFEIPPAKMSSFQHR